MTALTSLLKDLEKVNQAIAKGNENLNDLREKRHRLNAQISAHLIVDNEMDSITKGLQKTREALTL